MFIYPKINHKIYFKVYLFDIINLDTLLYKFNQFFSKKKLDLEQSKKVKLLTFIVLRYFLWLRKVLTNGYSCNINLCYTNLISLDLYLKIFSKHIIFKKIVVFKPCIKSKFHCTIVPLSKKPSNQNPRLHMF